MKSTSRLFAVDAPRDYDIEAVRPHLRRHLKPHKLLINGSEVTVWGKSPKDAINRFSAMTGGSVGFVFPQEPRKPTAGKKRVKGIRKGELSLIVAKEGVGKSIFHGDRK
jgi:hypothetical protein